MGKTRLIGRALANLLSSTAIVQGLVGKNLRYRDLVA